MRLLLALPAIFGALAALALPSFARAQEAAMKRVLSCKGPDARMEVRLPRSVLTGRGVNGARLEGGVNGQYTLDLSAAGKGKPVEPVRVTVTPDKSAVIIDQFTRKLPPTRVPVKGGVVDFDQRFGTKAKCGAFNQG